MLNKSLIKVRAMCALYLVLYSAFSFSANNDPIFKPVVDARGFIDVWQLRNDVALVPNRAAIGDTDFCGTEGDDYEAADTIKPPSAKEIRRRAKVAQQEQASAETCVKNIQSKTAEYDRIFAAFNRAWLPVMMNAINKGDMVAEVILRQCTTTHAFDRSGFESICDPEPKRSKATLRLAEIGFPPAQFDCQRSELPEVQIVDYPRAFTFYRSSYGVWKTDSFACLSLHRKPQTPGYMTWGRQLHHGGGNSLYDSGLFVIPSKETLARSAVEIGLYLEQDPRWAVFLLTRVGRHEWMPEGTKSTTHILDASWLGEWELEKETYDWSNTTAPMSPRKGHALITRNGEFTQISIQSVTPKPPLLDVADCTLRYSGGLTFNYNVNNEVDATDTNLGYFGTGKINSEALVPLDPKKRYKQVLMQCPNAEADDNNLVRFMLLAGDTLIEVANDPYVRDISMRDDVAIRHYRRVK
jgi:hypothetical protein